MDFSMTEQQKTLRAAIIQFARQELNKDVISGNGVPNQAFRGFLRIRAMAAADLMH
jgi:hypothetical protein